MFPDKKSLSCLSIILLVLLICGNQPALGRHIDRLRRPRHHHSSKPETLSDASPNDLFGNNIDRHVGHHRQDQPEDFLFLPDKLNGRNAGGHVNERLVMTDERNHLGDRRNGLIFEDGDKERKPGYPMNGESVINDIDALENGEEGLIFDTAPTTPVVDTRFIIDAPKRDCPKPNERMDNNGKCRPAL